MKTLEKCPFSEVLNHAEAIKNDGEHTPVFDVGDQWCQGDIGIIMIGSIPKDAVKDAKPQAQLAPGNTQGSRHCLRSLDGLTLYRLKNPTVLDGPVIDAPNGCSIDHPEHGNVNCGPGVYAIIYQRAFAQELRRTQD